MQVRIRDIPDPIHRTLKSWAALEGKSLNDLLVEILKQAVERKYPKK
jgi:plasmid stability protein